MFLSTWMTLFFSTRWTCSLQLAMWQFFSPIRTKFLISDFRSAGRNHCCSFCSGWLSCRNSVIYARRICNGLSRMDIDLILLIRRTEWGKTDLFFAIVSLFCQTKTNLKCHWTDNLCSCLFLLIAKACNDTNLSVTFRQVSPTRRRCIDKKFMLPRRLPFNPGNLHVEIRVYAHCFSSRGRWKEVHQCSKQMIEWAGADPGFPSGNSCSPENPKGEFREFEV